MTVSDCKPLFPGMIVTRTMIKTLGIINESLEVCFPEYSLLNIGIGESMNNEFCGLN